MYKVPVPVATPDIRFGADGKYSLDGGVNLWRQETALAMNQAAKILNLNADDRGTLCKRKGQALLDVSLGSGGCTAIVYKGKIVKQWGNSLYAEDIGGTNPVVLSGLNSSARAFFIPFQGLLYIMNGTDFLQYDGTMVTQVYPYIPVVSQGRSASGTTTTLYEPLNLLSGGFKDMFSPDGTSKTFYMSFKNLDAHTMSADNNGVITTEGSGFSADYYAGTVTFTTAPAAGTNTLKITAYKTNPTDALQITGCTYAIEFASRLFFTGNIDPKYKNKIWKTGITSFQPVAQANYFPASGFSSFDSVTSSDYAVTAFIKKFDKLIYFKSDSVLITEDVTNTDGLGTFPISSINETIGSDMPGSVQLVDNMPIFFNSLNGGYVIKSTTVLGENEVKDISMCINGAGGRAGLLQESLYDLQHCSSYNDGGKYYLCMPTSGTVYVWDYSLGYDLNNQESLHWFIYDNIHASNFFIANNTLCYASAVDGSIVRFIDALNDFGSSITAVWQSKLMDFGMAEYFKNITELWITTRSNSNSSLTVNYYDDGGSVRHSFTVPSTTAKSFSWLNWKWSTFTWVSQKFAPTIRLKPGIKGVRYFQMDITNDNANEDLSIVSLVIKWCSTKKVK